MNNLKKTETKKATSLLLTLISVFLLNTGNPRAHDGGRCICPEKHSTEQTAK